MKLGGVVIVIAGWALGCSEATSERPSQARDGSTDSSTDSPSTEASQSGQDAGGLDGGQFIPPTSPPCPTTAPTCPSAAPSEGAPCALWGFACEYGDDPLSSCNTVAECGEDGGWQLQSPLSGGSCPTVLSAACPPSFAAAWDSGIASDSGVACPATSYFCDYPQGTCACDMEISINLECSSPPLPTCPATRPRFGTPCSSEAGSCTQWGNPCDGVTSVEGAHCACGSWRPYTCPPPP
jgi:hypothetical protein